MNSWSERVAGELHAKLVELSSNVSKGQGEAYGAEAGPDFDTRERRGLAAAPMGDDDATTAHISHVIYRGHFSRHPKTLQYQRSKFKV